MTKLPASVVAAIVLAVMSPAGLAQPRRGPLPPRPKGAPRADNALERLSNMSPEQRRNALRNLPPERKKQLEQRLDVYKQMSPAEKERLADRLGAFSQLPPDQQEQARRLFRRFTAAPVDRQPLLRDELAQLRSLSDPDRRARMNSDEFRTKFNQQEQYLLGELSRLLARN